ncbi:hypothetical protein CPB83DRAFT_841510 [Crepidotus variabilis]|uniref:Uncharacterized protein n=1 Tax=Crepidotus variabilis TaxID=179855 RepID=A0A9P6EU56_9AGAR|nr:hypothetical protein CPB83DRAFT_841510 [Crepidotus variabilis]
MRYSNCVNSTSSDSFPERCGSCCIPIPRSLPVRLENAKGFLPLACANHTISARSLHSARSRFFVVFGLINRSIKKMAH